MKVGAWLVAVCAMSAFVACSSNSGSTDGGTGGGTGGAAGGGSGGGTGGAAGGGSGGGGGADAGDPGQACMDEATALCQLYDRCEDGGTYQRYGSFSVCVQRQQGECLLRLAAPGQGNTASGVEQCAVARQSQSCLDLWESAAPAECAPVPGTLPDSSACAFNGQCQSAHCVIPRLQVCGSCGAAPVPGGDCTLEGSAGCVSHETCVVFDADAGVVLSALCVPYAGVGSPCDRKTPCEPFLSCVGNINYVDGGEVMGSCAAEGNTVGATCDPRLRTDAGCDIHAGLYCNGGSKSCQPVTYVQGGDACGNLNDAGIDTVCSNASFCFYPAPGNRVGSCLQDAPDNTSCDTVAGPTCMAPSKCVTSGTPGAGTCLAPIGSCQ